MEKQMAFWKDMWPLRRVGGRPDSLCQCLDVMPEEIRVAQGGDL